MRPTNRFISRTSALLLPLLLALQAQAATPTQTTLTLSASPTVETTTVITLTATVTSTGSPVHPGTVLFCNAAAPHCQDTAILGSAQLNSIGTAKLPLRLPPNTYSIKAIFQGTPHSPIARESSTSTTETLTVKGLSPTITGPITATPDNGRFDLSAPVAGFGAGPLTGTVTFQDSVHHGTPLTLGSTSITATPPSSGFTPVGSVPLPVYPLSLEIADVNNDGLPDFVTLNDYSYPNDGGPGSLDLVILLNQGDGSYKTITHSLPSIEALGLACGDFNGDGNLDIVIYDYIGHTLTPMLGDGHGNFTALTPFSITQFPSQLFVADINGDGNLDLMSIAPPSSPEIFYGTGTGTFTPAPTLSSPVVGLPTLLRDVNGDGIPDLVAIDSNYIIHTYLGTGEGTFTPKWQSQPQITGYSIALADFNGDGKPDLLSVDAFDKLGHILLGNGDGSFTESYTFGPSLGTLIQVDVGDFNGDGKPDAAFSSDAYLAPNIQIALGNGDGTLAPPYATISFPTYYPTFIATDLNHDGLTDLLLTDVPSISNLYTSEILKSADVADIPLGTNLDHVITADYSGSDAFSPSAATYDVITFSNVTSRLGFTSSGFLYSRANKTYNGTMTVTNISSSAIPGPLQIGLTNIPTGISLLNAPVKKNEGFFTAPAGLAPGQSVSFPLQFSNPQSLGITYNTIAYTGAF